jgi:hypothetical protein
LQVFVSRLRDRQVAAQPAVGAWRPVYVEVDEIPNPVLVFLRRSIPLFGNDDDP